MDVHGKKNRLPDMDVRGKTSLEHGLVFPISKPYFGSYPCIHHFMSSMVSR